MRRPWRLRRRAETRENGASIVELALVLPLFLLLLFGIIDFGAVLSNQNAIRSAAREGARQAVVANFSSPPSCTINGTVSSAETKGLICYVKARAATLGIPPRVRALVPSPYTVGSSVTVCVQSPMDSITGLTPFLGDGRIMTTAATMRVEVVSGGDFSTGGETAPDGGDWSWCV